MSILDTIGKLAPILGGAAKSGQDANAQRDRNSVLAEQLRLNRDKFALDAPGKRLGTSTRASILSNFTPTRVSWGGPGSGLRGEIPQYSGGAAGSLANLDPQTKALAQQIIKDAIASQLRGGETGGGEDRKATLPDNFGKSSTGDKILGGASTATSILGALNTNTAEKGVPWWKKLLGLGGPGHNGGVPAGGTGGGGGNDFTDPRLWDSNGNYQGDFTDTPMYDPITGTWSNDHEPTGQPKPNMPGWPIMLGGDEDPHHE